MSVAIVGNNFIDDTDTYVYPESSAEGLPHTNLKDRQITKIWRTGDQPAKGDFHVITNPTTADWIDLGQTSGSAVRFTFATTGSSNVSGRVIRVMADMDDTIGEIWYVLSQYASGGYSGEVDDLDINLGGPLRTWNPPATSIASGPQSVGQEDGGPEHTRHLHMNVKSSLGTVSYPNGTSALPYGNGYYYSTYGGWHHSTAFTDGHIGGQEETHIQLEFSGQRLVDSLSLINHNFSGGAQWRVRFATDLTAEMDAWPNKPWDLAVRHNWDNVPNIWSYVAHTKWTDVWPTIGSFGTLPWGVFLWGTHVSAEQLDSYKPFSSHLLLEDPVYSKFIRIEVRDTAAPDYFEIGRIVVGKAWKPSRNMSRGWTLTYKDPSKITRSLGGQTYVDTLSKYRSIKFDLKYLTEEEIFENALELDRTKGSSGDVLVYTDINAPAHKLFKQTVYGRISKISPMKHNIGGYWTRSYQLEELL
jgi:hypothetical protein